VRVKLIGPDGQENITPLYPCFNHTSLPTLLDAAGVTWRYYANGSGTPHTGIWTAPNAISPICKPLMGTGDCNGSDWLNDVFFDHKQILRDLGADIQHHPCNLPNVSWVIPNGKWSDHPGMGDNETDSNDIEKGPGWVASIVNTLGISPCTDLINGHQTSYWNDTVIFIVWDDWGGWWDHVDPSTAPFLGVLLNIPNCSAWGCGYVHGFRVPFLVVSAYMATGNGQQGYVSGDTRTPGGGELPPYIHDFGSILAFIENNFAFGIGTINPQYQFADAYAPERMANPQAIPLADFFCISPCTAQPFQRIPVVQGMWQATDFLNYTGEQTDPDDDAVDDD